MSLDDRLSLKGLPAHTVVKISVDNLIKIKQAILADLLEIIGEDEVVQDGGQIWAEIYNVQRRELREKIKAYCD